MKRLFVLAIFLMTTIPMFAQQWVEVVYLKNGGQVRGTIIEQIPDKTLKIQTADGSIFVYNYTEVERIAKEQVQAVDRQERVNPGFTSTEILYGLLQEKLIYEGRGDFSLGGRDLGMFGSEFQESFMKENGYYETYKSAQRQRKLGNTLLPIGIAATGFGIIFGIVAYINAPTTISWTHYWDSTGKSWDSDYKLDGDLETFRDFFTVSMIFSAVGTTSLSIAIPMKIISKKRLNWIEEDYNEKHGFSSDLKVGLMQNGIGIAMTF